MSGDRKIFIEFSRCPESLASDRIKTKVNRLQEVARSHNAGFCVVSHQAGRGDIRGGVDFDLRRIQQTVCQNTVYEGKDYV